MSSNSTFSIMIHTLDNDTDHIIMLRELSKYFKVEYQLMLSEMTRDDISRLWHTLNGRSK
jgi:hypothetical protein